MSENIFKLVEDTEYSFLLNIKKVLLCTIANSDDKNNKLLGYIFSRLEEVFGTGVISNFAFDISTCTISFAINNTDEIQNDIVYRQMGKALFCYFIDRKVEIGKYLENHFGTPSKTKFFTILNNKDYDKLALMVLVSTVPNVTNFGLHRVTYYIRLY